jgi:glutathione peroxidase-family protein
MRLSLAVAVSAALLLAFAMTPSTAGPAKATAFDQEFEAIEGGKLPLSQWRGRVLLVVNTASFCGFTQQYDGLQKLWERYEGKGLVVLGVPSNDFGEQEPKSESEILGFCQGAFNVTFPLTTKQPVKGRRPPLLSLGARSAWSRGGTALELSQVPGRTRWQAHCGLRVHGRAPVDQDDLGHRSGAGSWPVMPATKSNGPVRARACRFWSTPQAAWPMEVS